MSRWRGLALLLVGLAACNRPPTARPGSETSAATSAVGAQVVAADLGDCNVPRGLLDRLRTLTVGATRAVSFDTAGLTNGDFRPACHVDGTGHFADSTLSEFDSLLSWLAQGGWRQARYQADGPDGSSTGWYRDGVTCIVSGMWDGGDDSDTTYVPSDTLTVAATCAKTAAVDTTPPTI